MSGTIWEGLTGGAPVEPASDEDVKGAAGPRPVVWLLGKTGAGKSSLVRSLTGVGAAEIGNGFAPCTRTAHAFDFPQDRPVMQFLDTRGLGEVGYDPAEDLAQCEARSHAILAVARLDDPVQGELCDALAAVRRRRPRTRVLVVHTAADQVPDAQARHRAQAATQAALEAAAGGALPSVALSLAPGAPDEAGLDRLVDLLGETMPDVALLLARRPTGEEAGFEALRPLVLWYAGAAGTSDVAPLIGAVTVPGIQAAMLRAMGRRAGVDWTRRRMGEFAAALGLGAALRYGGSYALRQAAKLIPGFGQTVGAAAAGTVSFAATYALGRAAAYYLHRTAEGQEISEEELRTLYRDAMTRARGARRQAKADEEAQ